MTELIYQITIFGTFAIAGITFWHARGNNERLAFLGASIVYGFLLEMAVIVLFGLHSYPTEHFFFYLGAVPIFIPLAWGVIIYTSFTTGEYLGLRRSHLPVFAGLFALHIDLAIEVVAIRIPLWTWHLSGIWFDVPIINFIGWYSVVFLFTGFFLHLEDIIENYVFVGLLSLLASTAVLLVIVDVWIKFIHSSLVKEVLLFSAVVIISILYLARVPIQPGPHLKRFPVETFISVLMIHLFYLQTILYYGYYQDIPQLLYMSIAMLLVGMSLYYIPYRMNSKADLAREHRKMGNQ